MSDLMREALAEIAAQEWEAEITPAGRWTWHIYYKRGLTCISTEWRGIAIGSREHAEAKARRAIARLRRDEDRLAASETVTQ